MPKFVAIELKGRSDMPSDWTFDGTRFRHCFSRDDAALFETEEEARQAVVGVPRRPDSTLAIFERK